MPRGGLTRVPPSVPRYDVGMIIGVPREVKDHETRVALTPAGVKELKAAGHVLLVEQHAGELSAV